jgi:phytoene dehydrogenase-like protein
MTIRPRLLKRVDDAWAAFTGSYAGLAEEALLRPGVIKTWSVRDIIVHVTTWEEEALKHLPVVLAGRRPPRYSVTYGGIDAFNALTSARKRDLPLADVFRQQAAVHRRLVALIERAPEQELASGTRFRNRLRLDTYGHYAGHAAAILRWRSRSGGSPDDSPRR